MAVLQARGVHPQRRQEAPAPQGLARGLCGPAHSSGVSQKRSKQQHLTTLHPLVVRCMFFDLSVSAPFAFPAVNRFCMAVSCGRGGSSAAPTRRCPARAVLATHQRLIGQPQASCKQNYVRCIWSARTIMHRCPMSLISLECQVTELANSDTRPRPTAG